ncbi:hypothetical protein ABHI18_001497, partial [Aspergillus niger]
MPVAAVGRPDNCTIYLTLSTIQNSVSILLSDVGGHLRKYLDTRTGACITDFHLGQPCQPQIETFLARLNYPPPQQLTPSPAPREILARNSWEMYEPCAGIDYGRIMVLARHRKNKANLVHIQMQAVERSAIEMCVQMIDRLAHRSIPRLLDVFQYAERYLLVWEPFECTLHEALALSCHIVESEVAQILWPVLKCLQFLRGQSRELASLTRDILFTEEGEIKIAGIENSRQIDQ